MHIAPACLCYLWAAVTSCPILPGLVSRGQRLANSAVLLLLAAANVGFHNHTRIDTCSCLRGFIQEGGQSMSKWVKNFQYLKRDPDLHSCRAYLKQISMLPLRKNALSLDILLMNSQVYKGIDLIWLSSRLSSGS